MEPSAFSLTRWYHNWGAKNNNTNNTSLLEDDVDEYYSACSDLEEEEEYNGEENSRFYKTPWQQYKDDCLLSSPGQVSLMSGSSGADSEQMHSSLIKSSLSRSTISEWLSSGSIQEELKDMEVEQQRKIIFEGRKQEKSPAL